MLRNEQTDLPNTELLNHCIEATRVVAAPCLGREAFLLFCKYLAYERVKTLVLLPVPVCSRCIGVGNSDSNSDTWSWKEIGRITGRHRLKNRKANLKMKKYNWTTRRKNE